MPSTTTTPRRPGKIDRVASALRQEIVLGRRQAGEQLPTQQELARKHRISEPSARVVLDRLAREGLVLRSPGRGSFVKEFVEQRPPATFTIDFIRPVEDPGQRRRQGLLAQMDAFARICAERGRRAIWHHRLLADLHHPDQFMNDLAGAHVVVVLSAPIEFSRALHRRGIAVVSVLPPPTSTNQPLREPFPIFDYNRPALVVGALEHLMRLGYGRIAFAGRQRTPDRMDAFLECLHRHNLHVSTEWVRASQVDDSSDLRPWLKQLLASDPRPQAICCVTDYVAACVERFLLDMGVRVPQDIAIATADSGPDAQEAPVPITTFGADYLEAAHLVVEAAEQLRPPLNPVAAPLLDPILLPLHLTIRESCGAKSAAAKVGLAAMNT